MKRGVFLSCAAFLLFSACARREVQVEFYRAHDYSFSAEERAAITTIAEKTALEVRRLLPALPRELILRVQAGAREDVIPETGETASSLPPYAVRWIVDPQRSGGALATIHQQLRATLFHEFHHLVRWRESERETILDRAVTEGLATAFERDSAGAAAPWGLYPAEVSAWLDELRALPPDADRKIWMFHHPDGRRWIGYKVGTYLADQAAARSKKTPAELAILSTEEVIALALADAPDGRPSR